MIVWMALALALIAALAAGWVWRVMRARSDVARREERRQRHIAQQQAWDAEVADWVRKRLSERDGRPD